MTRRSAIISGAAALAAYKGLGQYRPSGAVFPVGPPTTPTLVQGGVQTSGLSYAFPSGNTSGNCIVVWYVMNVTSGTQPTVSDTHSNSYTAYCQQTDASSVSGFFVATTIASGANTLTFSTFGASGLVIVGEFGHTSGVETSHPANQASSTITVSVGPITTSTVNTTVLLGSGMVGSVGTLSNKGGWGHILDGSRSISGSCQAYLWGAIEPTAGSYSNTANTTGGAGWMSAAMIGLKA